MSKSPNNDRPELTESAWIRDLAAPSSPEASATSGLDAPSPVPLPRVSVDRIDRFIHRLDHGVVTTVEPTPAAEPALAEDSTPAAEPTRAHATPSARAEAATAKVPEARSKARKPLLVLAAAALCALTVGGGTVAAMDKTVSVVIDGSPRQVTTLSGSVAGALAAAGVSPGAHDAVAPDVHAAISDGSTIVVDRGRPLTLTVDGRQRTVWTTARTVEDALTQLGASADLSLSANRSRQIPLDGLAVTASTLHTVRLAIAGGPATSSTTAATTVGELLTAQHVTLGTADRVRPAATTPLSDGITVTVDRIAVTSTTTTQVLPQPGNRTVADAALAKGTSKVVQRGRAGSRSISFQVTTVNGRQTAKREVARKTVVAPVATVTHVGTKLAPVRVAPKAAPPKNTVEQSTFTYSGSEVFTNDTSFGVNWDGLAMCESTHNPKAINANPSAGLPTYGMFQFDLPTWETVGGSGNPIDASPQEQLMRAKLLYQSRGLEPWACRDAAH